MKKILFLLFLIPIAGVSQNKKEQIATLNFKLDSLTNKISNERQASKKEIEENEKKISSQKAQLIKLYDRVKKLNESLESEKANLNTQIEELLKLKSEYNKLENKFSDFKNQQDNKIKDLNKNLLITSNELLIVKDSLDGVSELNYLLSKRLDSILNCLNIDTSYSGLNSLSIKFKNSSFLNEAFEKKYADLKDSIYDLHENIILKRLILNYIGVLNEYFAAFDEDGNLIADSPWASLDAKIIYGKFIESGGYDGWNSYDFEYLNINNEKKIISFDTFWGEYHCDFKLDFIYSDDFEEGDEGLIFYTEYCCETPVYSVDDNLPPTCSPHLLFFFSLDN